VLQVTRDVLDRLVAQAYAEYPDEMCGLLAGPPAGDVAVAYYPCRNAAASARVYTIDPSDHLRAERDADDHDWEINGVVHSHTHSEPYPSPTDVGQAPDPAWHYVIVSLKRDVPEVRSYRIVDGEVTEELLAVD
jgi:proteasome lid subunit RPN8/RPN11